jgi:hypothetical protein
VPCGFGVQWCVPLCTMVLVPSFYAMVCTMVLAPSFNGPTRAWLPILHTHPFSLSLSKRVAVFSITYMIT